jgi:hypothetical protein
MDDYEYRTVIVPAGPKKQSRELSKLGKDGWELVQVKHVLGAGRDRATLRRPASAKATNPLATGTLGLLGKLGNKLEEGNQKMRADNIRASYERRKAKDQRLQAKAEAKEARAQAKALKATK